MKISTKGIYALEMVVDLAIYADDENRASIPSVAGRRKISEKYLERIASMLKKAGIVKSTRGAGAATASHGWRKTLRRWKYCRRQRGILLRWNV